jgi:hypothetical protein
LAIEIPDTQAPLSLFQGFHASYPAYSDHGVISKHHIRRKKHGGSDKRRGSVSDKGKGKNEKTPGCHWKNVIFANM